MRKFLDNWRFYSFGKDQYNECMNKVFINNLNSLRQANTLVFILAISFAVVLTGTNLLLGKGLDLIQTAAYFIVGLIALILSLHTNYKIQTGDVSNKSIYLFIALFFLNIIAFGIYLSIWLYPEHIAAFYLCILIVSLLMFINPPVFNLVLILFAISALITCSFLFRDNIDLSILDAYNTIMAGVLTLFFSWHITKLRLGMEMSTTILEEERNKYLNQSTVDELTQLNNRRDFMATFKRYLNNYRTSDDYLCIAIADIDFFKNYNDHYGHPQGDECLRGVGRAFMQLRDNMGVYAARVGGEEFAMLWFEKNAAHVDEVVSNFFNQIKEMKMPHVKSKVSDIVTMSLGVYIEKLGASHDAEALYELADKALYAAKGSGRNCAVITGRGTKQYKITPDDGLEPPVN